MGVFKSLRPAAQPAASIDLATVRATVSYMHDDAARTPGMERLAMAFGAVLREIDAAERMGRTARPAEVVKARFVPFRR